MTKKLTPITPGEILFEEFLKLGQYSGIEPEFWLNLQLRYNMKVAQDKIGQQIKREVKRYQAPQGDVVQPSA